MKKILILVGALLLINFVCFAQQMEPVSAASQTRMTDQRLAAVATAPESASQAPLFGILAVGFLCAGYMTLKSD
jgi:hypothetical protein